MKKIALIVLLAVACRNAQVKPEFNCEHNNGLVFQMDSLQFYKGCVEELILDNDTIFEIPLIIEEVSKLTEIKFSKCHFVDLKGAFERLSKIKNLKKLTIDIESNGAIPKEIGLLQNLGELKITIDSTGVLPDEFYSLNHLKALYVYSTTYKEDKRWMHFSSLTELGISAKLDKMPDFIFKLDSLQKLDLSNNSLKVIPDEISRLSVLKEINITNNPIVLEDKNWHDLKTLKELKKKCHDCTVVSNVSTFR